MNKYLILCVDDDRQVLDAVVDDLAQFEQTFEIEASESVDEARAVLDDMEQSGCKLALILCDHIMPGTLGVDFLKELYKRPSTSDSRKILLTGQADQQATIEAVNHGGLDYYIAKPWQFAEFIAIVTTQLTDFIITHENEQLLSYANMLDAERIFAAATERRMEF